MATELEADSGKGDELLWWIPYAVSDAPADDSLGPARLLVPSRTDTS